MSFQQVRNCTHIKVNGVRCGSPALRSERFCYFHQRMIRSVKYPDSRVHHVALLENEEAIQASIMELVNALLRGSIEVKRAEIILRALNTAVRNAHRVHFNIHASDMVRQVPDFEEDDGGTASPHPAPDPTQPKPPASVQASPAQVRQDRSRQGGE